MNTRHHADAFVYFILMTYYLHFQHVADAFILRNLKFLSVT